MYTKMYKRKEGEEMEKYCSKCGKELVDGVCDCEEGETSSKVKTNFMDNVMGILRDALHIFTNPNKVIEEKDTPKFAWAMNGGIQTIVLFVALSIGMNQLLSLAFGGFYGFLGFSIGDYLKLFLILLIVVVIFLFLFVSLIYLIMVQILKAKASYMDVLNKFSYPSLIITVVAFVSVLVSIVSSDIGTAVFGFGVLYFVIVTYNMIKSYFKIDDNKNMLLTPVVVMVTILLGSLIAQRLLISIIM